MHSIRLRGPWDLFLPGSEAPRRVEMPATWQTLLALTAESPLPSPARLVRRFGLPTGIAQRDQLHLVIDSATVPCQVELNGQPLGNIGPSGHSSSFDVTTLLAGRNELAILLEIPPLKSEPVTEGSPLGDVRLEITPQPE